MLSLNIFLLAFIFQSFINYSNESTQSSNLKLCQNSDISKIITPCEDGQRKSTNN